MTHTSLAVSPFSSAAPPARTPPAAAIISLSLSLCLCLCLMLCLLSSPDLFFVDVYGSTTCLGFLCTLPRHFLLLLPPPVLAAPPAASTSTSSIMVCAAAVLAYKEEGKKGGKTSAARRQKSKKPRLGPAACKGGETADNWLGISQNS